MTFLTDLVNSVLNKILFRPQAITSNTTVNGTVSDFIDGCFRGDAFALIVAGTLTDGSYAIKLQEGDASNGSDMADITGATASLAATDDDTIKYIAFKRTKRYVRAVITSTGVTSGGLISITGHVQKQRPGGTALVP